MRKSRPLPMTPPPPQKEWLRRCSSMISSRRILNLKELLNLCSYLMLRAKETGWFFLYDMIHWDLFPRIRLLLGDSCTQFYRSCFSSTGDSGYYSQKLQHLNMTSDTQCSRTPMIAVTLLHVISVSRSWIILLMYLPEVFNTVFSFAIWNTKA